MTWIRSGDATSEVATRYWQAFAGAWASLPSVNLRYSASASLAVDGAIFLNAQGINGVPEPVLWRTPCTKSEPDRLWLAASRR